MNGSKQSINVTSKRKKNSSIKVVDFAVDRVMVVASKVLRHVAAF